MSRAVRGEHHIARGSLYETISLLIIFHKNGWIDTIQLDEAKTYADEIGKMLSGLISAVKDSIT